MKSNQNHQSPSTDEPNVPASLSRRSFLGMGAIGAGSLGALALLGCTPQQDAARTGNADAATTAAQELAPADRTEECDVVVVGLGTSGAVAAATAAREGAHVIGLDRVSSMAGTNAAMVSGVFAVESKPELKYDNHLTTREAFDYIWSNTHYQANAAALRTLLPATGKAIDLMEEGGVTFMYAFEGVDETAPMLYRGGHIYATSGKERADSLQNMLDINGVDARWDVQATNILTEEGKIVGVRYQDGSDAVDVKAANTIIATGGFIHNEEMLKQHFSGSLMYCTGNLYNDGSGITMAQAAGAQIGKNFSTSINESGACNMKSSDQFVSLTDSNATPVFSLPLFGGLLVNKQGARFMDEGKMAKETMYCGEPLLREGVYYAVIDQAMVDKLATTPVLDFISEDAFNNMAPGVQAGFQGKTLSALPEKLETGIEEGWIWKADSAQELAAASGLADLAKTLDAYNGFCQSGDDAEMYKEAQFLKELSSGPLYAIELQIAAWITLGGIKTDSHCRAVDEEGNPLDGLFIVGADGDFWTVPYFQGGSCQGFCVGSGYVAGVAAAQKTSA